MQFAKRFKKRVFRCVFKVEFYEECTYVAVFYKGKVELGTESFFCDLSEAEIRSSVLAETRAKQEKANIVFEMFESDLVSGSKVSLGFFQSSYEKQVEVRHTAVTRRIYR